MRTDHEIKDDILEELDWDPQIKSSDIGVTVREGVVRLYGSVQSYTERVAADKAARQVKGVRAITDEIAVKHELEPTVTDTDIAARIATLWEWNQVLKDFEITADVHEGHVTLFGEVLWNYQRETAYDQVVGIEGVTGVNNQIRIKPHASATNVKRKITAALHRSANLEASRINIEVEGGKVTLKGDVNALYERDLIEKAAWTAPGVTEVHDEIHISAK